MTTFCLSRCPHCLIGTIYGKPSCWDRECPNPMKPSPPAMCATCGVKPAVAGWYCSESCSNNRNSAPMGDPTCYPSDAEWQEMQTACELPAPTVEATDTYPTLAERLASDMTADRFGL